MSNPCSCMPTEQAIAELRRAWAWRLPAQFRLVLVSSFGDAFYMVEDESIHWLNTGTAEITCVANSLEKFNQKLRGDDAFEWLMPDLAQALVREGKCLAHGECYTYAVLPIFQGGEFETWNFKPAPAEAHFGITGYVHQQMADLPEGVNVLIKVS